MRKLLKIKKMLLQPNLSNSLKKRLPTKPKKLPLLNRRQRKLLLSAK